MAYERKCSNWLKTYKDWIMPRINAPESYVFWSGVFCLSAAIRRKVYIGKDFLGTWECFPHCYIILVGPPGFRKNTSMGEAIGLLEELHDGGIITKAPTLITKESMVDSIMKSPDGSIFFTVEEFGDLILKSGPEMYELLTSLFDSKKKLDQGTMSRTYELAMKPCVNLLAGTTPQWIANKMPESVIGGGLASRIIFIFEDIAPDDRIFFQETTIPGDFAKMRQMLLDDLAHIANNIEGKFQIDQKGIDWLEDWNKKRKKGTDPKLSGYYARKITHILKISQLFHISYSDTLVLSIEDIQSAVGIVETIERNLPRVFAGVGKNVYSLDSREINEYIKAHSGVRKENVFQAFQNVATTDKIELLMQGLMTMKLVRSEYEYIEIDGKKETIQKYYPINQDGNQSKLSPVDGTIREPST